MNAKALYDLILRLTFAIFLLMGLLSFVVFRNSSERPLTQNENTERADPTAAVKKVDPRLARGKALFKNNCGSCHNKNMTDDSTGPALKGVEERWADYPKEDLYKWIRNSQMMVAEGHPRAKYLVEKWKVAMNAFPRLTDEDIEGLLLYVGE